MVEDTLTTLLDVTTTPDQEHRAAAAFVTELEQLVDALSERPDTASAAPALTRSAQHLRSGELADDARAVLSAASAGWYKSSASQGESGCVEVNHAAVPGYVGVRDSKLGGRSPVLLMTAAGFQQFLTFVTEPEGPRR